VEREGSRYGYGLGDWANTPEERRPSERTRAAIR
jgi:hypothetical protein